MKEFIKVYEDNQEDIEKFIITTLKNNGSILAETSSNYKKVFKTFPSMELLYVTDSEYTQCAPNVFRNKIEVSAKGKVERTLVRKSCKKKTTSLSLHLTSVLQRDVHVSP